MRKEKVTVAFDEESVIIDEEKYTEWKDWRKQNWIDLTWRTKKE